MLYISVSLCPYYACVLANKGVHKHNYITPQTSRRNRTLQVDISRPTRHRLGHFGHVLSRQSRLDTEEEPHYSQMKNESLHITPSFSQVSYGVYRLPHF